MKESPSGKQEVDLTLVFGNPFSTFALVEVGRIIN